LKIRGQLGPRMSVAAFYRKEGNNSQ
jgi:hypothetical protein